MLRINYKVISSTTEISDAVFNQQLFEVQCLHPSIGMLLNFTVDLQNKLLEPLDNFLLREPGLEFDENRPFEHSLGFRQFFSQARVLFELGGTLQQIDFESLSPTDKTDVYTELQHYSADCLKWMERFKDEMLPALKTYFELRLQYVESHLKTSPALLTDDFFGQWESFFKDFNRAFNPREGVTGLDLYRTVDGLINSEGALVTAFLASITKLGEQLKQMKEGVEPSKTMQYLGNLNSALTKKDLDAVVSSLNEVLVYRNRQDSLKYTARYGYELLKAESRLLRSLKEDLLKDVPPILLVDAPVTHVDLALFYELLGKIALEFQWYLNGDSFKALRIRHHSSSIDMMQAFCQCMDKESPNVWEAVTYLEKLSQPTPWQGVSFAMDVMHSPEGGDVFEHEAAIFESLPVFNENESVIAAVSKYFRRLGDTYGAKKADFRSYVYQAHLNTKNSLRSWLLPNVVFSCLKSDHVTEQSDYLTFHSKMKDYVSGKIAVFRSCFGDDFEELLALSHEVAELRRIYLDGDGFKGDSIVGLTDLLDEFDRLISRAHRLPKESDLDVDHLYALDFVYRFVKPEKALSALRGLRQSYRDGLQSLRNQAMMHFEPRISTWTGAMLHRLAQVHHRWIGPNPVLMPQGLLSDALLGQVMGPGYDAVKMLTMWAASAVSFAWWPAMIPWVATGALRCEGNRQLAAFLGSQHAAKVPLPIVNGLSVLGAACIGGGVEMASEYVRSGIQAYGFNVGMHSVLSGVGVSLGSSFVYRTLLSVPGLREHPFLMSAGSFVGFRLFCEGVDAVGDRVLHRFYFEPDPVEVARYEARQLREYSLQFEKQACGQYGFRVPGGLFVRDEDVARGNVKYYKTHWLPCDSDASITLRKKCQETGADVMDRFVGASACHESARVYLRSVKVPGT